MNSNQEQNWTNEHPFLVVTLGILGFVIFVEIIGGNSSSNQPQPPSVSTSSSEYSSTSSFPDGTYIVGVNIQPGTYRSSGGTPDCYYERLSGFGGTDADIIANNNVFNAQAIISIVPTDKGFSSSGCGTWTPIQLPASTIVVPSSTTATPSVISQSQKSAATWHVAYTYNFSSDSSPGDISTSSIGTGYGDIITSSVKTPTFPIRGVEQEIVYACSATNNNNPLDSFDGGIVGATLSDLDNDNFADFDNNCPTTSSKYENSLIPGQYNLVLAGFNAYYSVTVLDYY